jgi:hypothetical protein
LLSDLDYSKPILEFCAKVLGVGYTKRSQIIIIISIAHSISLTSQPLALTVLASFNTYKYTLNLLLTFLSPHIASTFSKKLKKKIIGQHS